VDALAPYRSVWCVDFEFYAPPGERPLPLCCVARELRSGRLARLWLAGDSPSAAPYPLDPRSLFVAYYASAELGCHLAQDWPMPARILDLYAEFRCLTSGLPVPCGNGLLGALAYYGLDALDAIEKEEMRHLAMRGGPYSEAERLALLDYCQSDVDALARLLPVMLPRIDLPRALLRGRYMAAAARIEWNGIPIDADTLTRLRDEWERIKGRLILAVNDEYGVFVPVDQRPLDPDSRFGAAVLDEAARWGLDPQQLANAVNVLWREERQATAGLFEARRAARKKTGLTHRRIALWEALGRDHSTYPGLDTDARELVGAYPQLGIGAGYSAGAPDDLDQPVRLWELLRDHDEVSRPRHDRGLTRQAAEWLASLSRETELPAGPMRFSSERWAAFLAHKGIAWPRLPSGQLALDDEAFREMARAYPVEVGPIRELRNTLSQLRLQDLTIGSDGRNRYLLSAFSSRTGRNQPSNSKAIFGPATWLRSLIQPAPGQAVAYCDWSAQELAIAAALSGDQVMQEAYLSGDPYLFLAGKAGAVPPDATKKSHAKEREQFKVVSLGVLYGLSAEGLARRLDVPPCRGRQLLQMHRETFRRFWEWSDRIEMQAMLTGRLQTVFGWRVHVGVNVNPRSLRNFPMQATGAEMLRLACCLATEEGIRVCAPVHDALLVEGPVEEIETITARTREHMRQAAAIVLDGFQLRTEAKVICYPERYVDERGKQMWETVCSLLAEQESDEDDPGQNGRGTQAKMARPAPYLIPSFPDRDIDSTPCLPF
jgi:hypothetical protein